MREKIGKITLDDTCYSGSDLYSDGPVERNFWRLRKAVTRRKSIIRSLRREKAGR